MAAQAKRRRARVPVSFVATKTTTVRGEDGQDERLVAGRTHVHDGRHFLVTSYPHLFKRTDGRPMTGRTRPIRQRAQSAARQNDPAPRWKPLIRLNTWTAPTFTVRLLEKAYRPMTDLAFGQRGRLETGGALFGPPARPDANTATVAIAGVPGPAARTSRGSMHVDLEHIRRQAAELQRDGSDHRWCGHWHTHPDVGAGQPSNSDLEFFAWDMRELTLHGCPADHYVGLILTPNWGQDRQSFVPYPSWVKPTIHAWHMRHVGEGQYVCGRAEVVRT